MGFTHLSWWPWGGKKKTTTATSSRSSSDASSLHYTPDLAFVLGEPLNMDSKILSSPRATRRKRHRGKGRRKIDPDYDLVLVPSDGECFSGSDSGDDSDWSIGWLEPHGPEFQSEAETENSFAVLVRCYGYQSDKAVGGSTAHIVDDIDFTEDNKYLEDLLLSLLNKMSS